MSRQQAQRIRGLPKAIDNNLPLEYLPFQARVRGSVAKALFGQTSLLPNRYADSRPNLDKLARVARTV
jgi:hypothetical protein